MVSTPPVRTPKKSARITPAPAHAAISSMAVAPDRADVHLNLWPGGERRRIAQSDFRGDVKVL